MTLDEQLARRRRVGAVALLGIVLMVLGATGYILLRLREEVIGREMQIASLQARAFEDHLTQNLTGVERTLVNLADLSPDGPRGREALRREFDAALSLAPFLRSLAVLDENGRVIGSSNPRVLGRLFGGAGFQPEVTAPTEVLRVGPPWRGRDFDDGQPLPAVIEDRSHPNAGAGFIPLMRDVSLPGGRWTTLTASLNVDFFLNYYSAHLPSDVGKVKLLRYDGLLLLSTDDNDIPGFRHAEDIISRRLSESEIGSFEERLSGGSEVFTAYRASRFHPFVVVVQIDRAVALAGWRREATLTAAMIGTVLTGLIFLASAYWRRVERSERVRAAAAEDMRLAASVFETSQEAIVITSPAAEILRVNAAFTAITGYSRDEVKGKNPRLLASGVHDREFYTAMWQSLANTGSWQGEISNRRRDGYVYTEWLTISRVLDDRGRVVNYVGVFMDISARKKAENELRLAAATFETQEGVMITDAQACIIRVNPAFVRTTGYTAEEAIGRKPSLLKSGRHDENFYRLMWDSLARTGIWRGEIWNRRKNGEIFPEWLTISAVVGAHGHIVNYVATFSDITERKQAEDEIRHLAYYDPLTGLPNRRLLLDRLRLALAAGARNKLFGALLFIDLDDFKNLNDSFGHDVGDLLLQQVAGRLSGAVREGDTVARLGGDEFVVMLEDLSRERTEAASRVEVVAEKVLADLNQPYQIAGQERHSTPSIGITLFFDHSETVDELLKRADVAMYQAKSAGRNTVRFFDPIMQAAIEARTRMEAELRLAVRDGQLLLHYQIQVDTGGRPIGAEALVRWQHPGRGLVTPIEFIPLAEDCGLIYPVGQWVLETACAQLAAWGRDETTAHLTMAVNVSVRQFRHPDFVDQVLATVAASGANPRRLKLELTESLLLDDLNDTASRMAGLKLHGVGFSLDDFGTGYSSLNYLKRLPLDQIKIDQSFVRDVLEDANDAAIARTIVALGHSLSLPVIAEGVETEAQRAFLVESGCNAFQGYLFGRPVPAEQLLKNFPK